MAFSLEGAVSGGLSSFLVTGNPLIAAGGAVLAGIAGGKADGLRRDAAGNVIAGNNAAIAENQRQFDLTRADTAPFLENSINAQNQALDILGNPIDENELFDLAGKQAGRFASAGGTLGTGTFKKDLFRGVADVRSNLRNNRISQLLQISGSGPAVAGIRANAGAGTAGRIGSALQNSGDVSAGLDIGRANSIDNLINVGTSLLPFLNSGNNSSVLPRNRRIGAGGRLPGESF